VKLDIRLISVRKLVFKSAASDPSRADGRVICTPLMPINNAQVQRPRAETGIRRRLRGTKRLPAGITGRRRIDFHTGKAPSSRDPHAVNHRIGQATRRTA